MKLASHLSFIISFIVLVKAGMYDVTIKDFEILVKGDTKHLNYDKLKLKRFNRTHPHVILGEMVQFETWDSRTEEFSGEIWKQQGYEFRPMPYKFKHNYCDFIENDKVFFPAMLEASDLDTKVEN